MNLPSKEHLAMNFHQTYAANLVAGWTAAELASMIAKPPGNRAKAHTVPEVHEWVTKKGVPETRWAWGELLAQAAAVPRQDDWPLDWATKIADLIFEIDVPDEAQVTELHQAAA